MEFESTVRKMGSSLQITIPADLCKWLKLQEGDKLIVQDEEGKKGKYFSTWKKKDD